ncbi:MAG: hypothetical protein RR838_10280 [Clostridium sp.]
MFKSILRNEFLRSFLNLKILGVFIIFAGVFLHIFYLEREATIDPIKYDFYNTYLKTMGYGCFSYMPMILPIIACLVCGNSLFQDISSGYVKFVLTRINYKKYINYKMIAVSIVTFTALVLFQLAGFLYSYITCSSYEKGDPQGDPMFLADIFQSYPLMYIIISIIIIAFVGTSITMVSMALSIRFKSVYTVVSTPWILCMLIGQGISLLASYIPVHIFSYGPVRMAGYFMYEQPFSIIVPFIYWGILYAAGYIITLYQFSVIYSGKKSLFKSNNKLAIQIK